MARKFLISRIALAVALSSGAAVALAPTTALAAKKKADEGAANYSKEFREAAGPIQEALNGATSKMPNPPQEADLQAAKASIDAALGGDAMAAFTKAEASASTPDDKNALGSMLRNYAIITKNSDARLRANKMMLESGKVAANNVGPLNFDAGVTAYQAQDYATAATYLKAAKDAGYTDPNNQLDAVLADAYKKSGNSDAALAMVKSDIEAAQAAGTAPSETSIRSALQAAYDSKQLQPSSDYAAMLVKYYPSPEAWNVSASIVRQLASLPKDQNIDLMRLMYASGGMKGKRDYLEYLENADPRAYPGEALKVMNQGLSNGALTSADLGGEKAATEARVKSDKASLPSQEADANKSGASVQTVKAAGDVFLSYDQYAKAEGFYQRALTMPGADTNTVALRLGMTQALQGKKAEAEANLAKVTGNQAAVAKLWSAYAAGKS